MLHKLHLCTGQLQHIAIFERDGLGTDGRPIQRRFVCPFDMGDDKTVRALGDGSDGNTRLANRGDDFHKSHLAPGGSA